MTHLLEVLSQEVVVLLTFPHDANLFVKWKKAIILQLSKSIMDFVNVMDSRGCFHVFTFHTKAPVFRRCSLEKGVLRNFAKFTGKHLRQSLFLIKLRA